MVLLAVGAFRNQMVTNTASFASVANMVLNEVLVVAETANWLFPILVRVVTEALALETLHFRPIRLERSCFEALAIE